MAEFCKVHAWGEDGRVHSSRLHRATGSDWKCLIIDSYKGSSEITRRCNTSHRIPTGTIFSKKRKSFCLSVSCRGFSLLPFSFKEGKLCRSQITWLWGVIGNWSSFISRPVAKDTSGSFQEQARNKPNPQWPMFNLPENYGRFINYFIIIHVFCSFLSWIVKHYLSCNLFQMGWIYQIIEIDMVYLHESDRLADGFAISGLFCLHQLLLEWKI